MSREDGDNRVIPIPTSEVIVCKDSIVRFLVSAIYTASAIFRPGLFLSSATARCFRSSQQYCRSLPGTAACLENQEAFLGEKAAQN